MTLSLAILISLVISLTATPMMCSRLLAPHNEQKPGRFFRASEAVFESILNAYSRTLGWALARPRLIMLVLFATIGLNVVLIADIPKGLFPQTDTGRINGMIVGDQSISFQLMKEKLTQFSTILRQDPAVAHVAGFTGGRQTNGGFLFISLKPLAERNVSADQVIARLRTKLAHIAGANLYLKSVQDVNVGGRQSNAQYQFTLESNNPVELYTWSAKLLAALQKSGELADLNSDQQQNGLSVNLAIDRDSLSRLGLSAAAIDNTLYDAFGQRQVSTIFNPLNQYHVVMEVAPQYWQSPEALKGVYISTQPASASGSQTTNAPAGDVSAATTTTSASSLAATIAADSARNQAMNSISSTGHGSASSGSPVSTSSEIMVPLSAVTHTAPGTTALAVNHQGVFAAATISFNLKPGQALSDATAIIGRTMDQLGMPPSIHASFSGTAATFTKALRSEPLLILAALASVYIVLGILYESYVHPLTILSTLPSAGVGAVLALKLCGLEFSVIALIGMILLIGIVKKNAIMMIDFALQAERGGMDAREAIRTACLLRFRPILMTTLAAAVGALPLALGMGEGAELRQPLGISIVGGLLASQLLTLYTTPVVYIYLDNFSAWLKKRRADVLATWRGQISPPASS
jgi:multidrug efflux pump